METIPDKIKEYIETSLTGSYYTILMCILQIESWGLVTTGFQGNKPLQHKGKSKMKTAVQSPRGKMSVETGQSSTTHDLDEVRKSLTAALKIPGVKCVHCPECGWELRSEAALRHHILKHTGNYSIRCDLCWMGFYARRELERHLLKHHGMSIKP